MEKTPRFVIAAILSCAPAFASATMYEWSSNVPLRGGGSLSGSGLLSTQDTLSDSFDFAHTGFTGYLITSITGTYDGVVITGLLPVNYSPSPSEPFGDDNLLNLTPTYIDNDGIAFSLASAPAGLSTSINLYFDVFSSDSYRAGGTSGIGSLELPGGSFTITPVTVASVLEPGSLSLLALGLAGLGILHRRRSLGLQSVVKEQRPHLAWVGEIASPVRRP